MHNLPKKQRGAGLLIALIMLVALTLVTVLAFNMGKSSLQVVSNLQHHNEGVNAANSVIEEAISSSRFYETPTSVLLNPCNGTFNTRCFDINGDGTNDIVVTLSTPICLSSRTLSNDELHPQTDSSDQGCLNGNNQDTAGVDGASTNLSNCANALWETSATAVDSVTSSQVIVTEGSAVKGKSC
jgi:Tfp pilus assembly protein PilX